MIDVPDYGTVRDFSDANLLPDSSVSYAQVSSVAWDWGAHSSEGGLPLTSLLVPTSPLEAGLNTTDVICVHVRGPLPGICANPAHLCRSRPDRIGLRA